MSAARAKRISAADEAAGRQRPDPRWEEAYTGLVRISLDPEETPRRRRRARRALDSLHSIDAALHTLPPNRTPHPRGQSGGDSLRADAEYDGWGRD